MSDSSNLLLLASGKGITGSTDSKKTNLKGPNGPKDPKDLNKIDQKKAKEILRYINLHRSLHLLKSGKFLTISQ